MGSITNITKIKYIRILDKVYTVTDISMSDMTITAMEQEVALCDVPADEVFDFFELDEFQIKFYTQRQPAQIINLAEWKQNKAKEIVISS